MLYLGKKDPGPVTTVVRLLLALTHFLLGHAELLFSSFVRRPGKWSEKSLR